MTDGQGARRRVVDVFLGYLKQEEVKVVYGIPGGLLYPFFEAVEADSDIDLVVAKHEEGAAFMADGYARVGRRLSVCAGTGGPGATNLLTGVACAFADGVPMLVVTGQAAMSMLGRGAAQETAREDMDIVAMFRPITKFSAMVSTAEQMPMLLRRALRHALTGRPGPVHLNVPVDLWEKHITTEPWLDPKTYRPETHAFDRQAVQRAAVALLSARKPILFAGAGVAIAGAAEHLRTLAELLHARVATTPRAKGVFPEDHPLSLGVLGFAGHAAARATLLGEGTTDVLFTVGTSLSEPATLGWRPELARDRTLIQLDVDFDRIGRNYPVSIALVGDAQTILVELIYHLHRLIREGDRGQSVWESEPPIPTGHETYWSSKNRTSDAVPLTPERWRCDLEEVLPRDAILFSDIGGHMLTNIHHLRLREGQTFVLNLGFGSMGHGTVAPIGAAMVQSSRPVFSIIGDACFAMNGMELLTAVEKGVPAIWIVENNQGHGITYHASQLVGSKRPLESVRSRRTTDVAAIARAMGLAAWVVDQPGQMQAAITEALATKSPCLVEVRVDPSVAPPLHDRVRSVAGAIEG